MVAAAAFASVVQAGQRLADAAPLVPDRLDVDGNFRIAPPYVVAPAFLEKPGVSKGRSEASGHVDRRGQLQTMPEAFEWVWKGYTPSGR